MRKLKLLFVILATFLMFPFGVFAEENTTRESVETNEVNLYFFHGDGCPHCEEAAAWFEEIEEEYGEYFNLVSYEVWSDEDNNNLMTAVAEARKETADGVPYIIIGNQSWSGFADEYKEGILSKIESEYEQDPAERYDIMDYVDLSLINEKDESNVTRDILILLVFVGVVGALAAGVVIARKKTN